MENQIIPVIDFNVLQQKANEAAMNGAIKTIEEFYTKWDSPYRKMVQEALNKTTIGEGIGGLELPDVVSLINNSLSKEIDHIANTALAKTWLPLVQEFLMRVDKNILFSDILKNLIEASENKYIDNFEVNITKHQDYGWLEINLSSDVADYKFTLHESHKSEKRPEDEKKYKLFSLPFNNEKHNRTMKISLDGASMELPFTKDILADKFVSYLARVIIAGSEITMDCREFSDHLFPQNECHCD